MVYAVRSAEYVPGKQKEALEFLRKVVAYHKKSGVEVEILKMTTPGPGQQARLWTVHRFASRVEMAEFEQKSQEDSEWRATVRAATDPGGCLVHNTHIRNNFDVL